MPDGRHRVCLLATIDPEMKLVTDRNRRVIDIKSDKIYVSHKQ